MQHLDVSCAQIEILKSLEAEANQGRGINCVRSIIKLLENNNIDDARSTREWDGDKTRNYPTVENQLHQMFGCRTHGILNCQKENCVYMRNQTLRDLKILDFLNPPIG